MWELLKTDTAKAAIASILTGIGMIIAGEIPEGINLIALGLVGLFGRRAALKIEKKIENGKK